MKIMNKIKSGALATLFVLPLIAQAQQGSHGGDAFIGTEFYTIANRLLKNEKVKSTGVEEFLKANLQIIPIDHELTYQGSRVDALSFNGPMPFTQVVTLNWALAECRSKYQLVLHELFVLKNIEPTLSYSVSSPIVEAMAQSGLDCSGLSENAKRIKYEEIRGLLASQKYIFNQDDLNQGIADPRLKGTMFDLGENNSTWNKMVTMRFNDRIGLPLIKFLLKGSLSANIRACFTSAADSIDNNFSSYLLQYEFPYDADAVYSKMRLSRFSVDLYAYCESRNSRNDFRRVQVLDALQSSWNINQIDGKKAYFFPVIFRKMRRIKPEINHSDWESLSNALNQFSEGTCESTPELLEKTYSDKNGGKLNFILFSDLLINYCERNFHP